MLTRGTWRLKLCKNTNAKRKTSRFSKEKRDVFLLQTIAKCVGLLFCGYYGIIEEILLS